MPNEKQREFIIHVAAFIIAMLVYAMGGFAYVHAQFLTRNEATQMDKRADRYEDSIEGQLKELNRKMDDAIKMGAIRGN